MEPRADVTQRWWGSQPTKHIVLKVSVPPPAGALNYHGEVTERRSVRRRQPRLHHHDIQRE